MATYSLPELAYDFGALEPHISGKIMELHHGKHHAAYVAGANTTLEKLEEAREERLHAALPALERAPRRSTRRGHVMHSIFWTNLAPKAGGRPSGQLAASVDRDFGSFDSFRGQLTQAAATVMGSAMAALAREPLARKLFAVKARSTITSRTSRRARRCSSCSTPGSTPITSSTRTARPSSSTRSGTCGTGRTSSAASRRPAPWSFTARLRSRADRQRTNDERLVDAAWPRRPAGAGGRRGAATRSPSNARPKAPGRSPRSKSTWRPSR